jgi:hypothetical protein
MAVRWQEGGNSGRRKGGDAPPQHPDGYKDVYPLSTDFFKSGAQKKQPQNLLLQHCNGKNFTQQISAQTLCQTKSALVQ